MQRLLTTYSNGRWKEGATCKTLGQKVKGKPSDKFLDALIFWHDILIRLGQYFFLRRAHINDNERKKAQKGLGQTVIDQSQ